jgi:GNAT superfamily N-acetyltransferase
MERTEIISLANGINIQDDINNIKNNLEKKYLISYGKYSEHELKKALDEKKPVIIKNHFLIGYEKKGFIDFKEKSIPIERMVKAVIVEGIKESVEEERSVPSDPFVIIGKNEWSDINDFKAVIGTLRVGEMFLPPHSAIFNFLTPSEEQKKKKIVSMLDGVNINLYEKEKCVDNAIHEIGHLFWRDCLNLEEKKEFKKLFQTLKPSALYEYEWERETEEEVFCTVYKWYVKSLLINKAFFNILEHEEPEGMALLQGVLSRVRREKETEDVWQLSQKDIYEYLNPKFDITTGRYLRKAGLLDRIKDVEIPARELQKIDRYENGVKFVQLEKAVVPVVNGRIDFENMEKARITKYIRRTPKPGGGWNYIYKEDSKEKKVEKKEILKDGLYETDKGYIDWDVYSDQEMDEDGNEIDGEKYVKIDNLFVKPEYRGRGEAKKMMNIAIAEIKKKYPGMEIKIVPEPKDKNTDKGELIDFYSKFPELSVVSY